MAEMLELKRMGFLVIRAETGMGRYVPKMLLTIYLLIWIKQCLQYSQKIYGIFKIGTLVLYFCFIRDFWWYYYYILFEERKLLMATVTVNPGVCGLNSVITVDSEDMQNAVIKIDTECPYIKAMGNEFKEVDGFAECFTKIGDGEVYKAAKKYCKHAACPVPSAIIKGIEVACGLALPKDVEFKIFRD